MSLGPTRHGGRNDLVQPGRIVYCWDARESMAKATIQTTSRRRACVDLKFSLRDFTGFELDYPRSAFLVDEQQCREHYSTWLRYDNSRIVRCAVD
jgi:hypothetical protein